MMKLTKQRASLLKSILSSGGSRRWNSLTVPSKRLCTLMERDDLVIHHGDFVKITGHGRKAIEGKLP